jgi:MoxR-like ATPase
MRVKIIDEYNRIPTKTQSCLLSLMAEGYAEMYEQIIHSDNSAWFLTANDDLGGGTFQVIDALKDRIDIVVRCTPFNTRYLEALATRIAQTKQPEDFMPIDIIFTHDELNQMGTAIRAIEIPSEVLEVLGFLISQLDFCRRASDTLEFQNKDTLHLAGRRVGHVCTEDCPLDKFENLCTQTESGVSARAYQIIIHYAKALAFFRRQKIVSNEDVRQILPWVLHEKLKPNPQSIFIKKTSPNLCKVRLALQRN